MALQEITAHDLKEKMDQKAAFVLLDVREDSECDLGILPGAINIPRANIESQIAQQCPNREQEIVVYCAAGGRSSSACDALQEMGYAKVSSLKGGFQNWSKQKLPIAGTSEFSSEQLERYARHLNLPHVGMAGQKKLMQTKILLVGAGGLGSPAALYLASSGVGTLGLIDHDVVDRSNLQRQILYRDQDVSEPKVTCAKQTLNALNPDTNIQVFEQRLTAENAPEILKDFDLIINGCDNFATRYLVNDACFFLGKPLVDGSVFQFEGRVSVYNPKQGGPCYRCLFPKPPTAELAPNCQEAGVLGILPGIIGTLQATEAIKLALDLGKSLMGEMLIYDALQMSFRKIKVQKDPSCTLCGNNPQIKNLQGAGLAEDFCQNV